MDTTITEVELEVKYASVARDLDNEVLLKEFERISKKSYIESSIPERVASRVVQAEILKRMGN